MRGSRGSEEPTAATRTTRREALRAIALAASAGFASLAPAQGTRQRARIAYLSLAPGPSSRSEALAAGLRDLGYVDGQNVDIEYRWAGEDLERLRQGAADLVRSGVDVIVTGGPQATRAAKEATARIPIVMAFDYDPVSTGFVKTLARPGGNVTGLSGFDLQLCGKRLELLRDINPAATRIALLRNSREPNADVFLRETQSAAQAMGLQVRAVEIHVRADLDRVLRAAATAGMQALVVLTDPVTLYNRTEVASLAALYRLPAIYSERAFSEAGGLMSYGASDRALHRRAAVYVDKILKGAQPAVLPVEQPTTFDLVINESAAKALGLTIPQALSLRAEII